ncbi:MAG: serpin family protein [Clostridiaceae bacterium]|nr:serpin family protein [Clostridiaceae bacterium]
MKRIVALCLSILMIISLITACDKNNTNSSEKEDDNSLSNDNDQSISENTQLNSEKNEQINGNEFEKAALASPDYPQMAQYPDEMSFIDTKTGEFDQEGFDQVYDAWRADRDKQFTYIEKFSGDYYSYFSDTSKTILADQNQKNPVYSPLSLYMALAMLAETTDGQSREQILNLLKTQDIASLRTDAEAIWNSNYCQDGALNSLLANSLWLDNEYEYQTDTIKMLSENYYASAFQGEMGSKQYNDQLHSWINANTGNLLSEQAGNLAFEPDTILGLVSTVLFQAKWVNQFAESNTKKATFHGVDEDIEFDFLNYSGSDTYYWAENFGAVRLPLESGGNMWFMLPDEDVEPLDIIKNDQFYQLLENDNWQDQKFLTVNFSVPKFDVSSDFNLNQPLQNLGIKDVFELNQADFTPILANDSDPAFLSTVKQGTRVAIDEEGVTAASFTAMMIAGAAMPPEEEIDFILDRPFVFVIDGISGLPIFVGIVNQVEP